MYRGSDAFKFSPALQRSSTPFSHAVNDHQSVSSRSSRIDQFSNLPLQDLLKPVITIKPQFALGPQPERPFILKPLMLLPREYLPLSALDLSRPSGEYPDGPGRFFESHIRILDLDGRLRQASSILLARSILSDTVYAIERHQPGLFVICKLGSWISIEKLSKLAEACYAPRCSPAQDPGPAEANAPVNTHQSHKEDHKKRQAIEELQSMVRKRQKSVAIEPQRAPSQSPVQSVATRQRAAFNIHRGHTSQDISIVPSAGVQTTAEDIFQNIRNQYFEALYHSKGSLAYFAKGTLSKARAAFHFDCDANLEMKDLLAYLKVMIIAVPQIDKKYKGTVPKLIEETKLLADSSEGARKSRRGRPKKIKLGKDGMWTGEIEKVRQWWKVNKPVVREDDEAPTNPEEIRYHISSLRTRETQLQMILLLEILALEAMGLVHGIHDPLLPGMTADSQQMETAAPAPKKKAKHDHLGLLNLHADRMSIWQSTMLDEMKMIAAEAQAKSGPQAQKPGRTDSNSSRDFCIDIIVPFFGGRLPELSADLNRKLGGPIAPSPPKLKKSTDQTMKAPAKPGAAARRPAAPKPPRSLVKVLEDDSLKWKASRARPGDVLARMRSATPAAIPGIKREASEPLGLDRLTVGDKPLKERSCNMADRGMSFAISDVKAQKKADEAKQIEEAISGIRKPNRSLVGRAIIEDAEKRTGTSSSPRPKKQRKPIRNAAAAAGHKVQVKATPANYRFKDAVFGDARSYGSFNPLLPPTGTAMIPSSSSVIPSTAPKKAFRDDLRDGLAAFHIASTPEAASTRFIAKAARLRPEHRCVPESSPIAAPKIASALRDHLTVPGTACGKAPSSPIPSRIFETPVKRRATTFSSILVHENITSTPPEPRLKKVFGTPAEKDPTLTSVPIVVPEPVHDIYKVASSNLHKEMGWEDDFGALF